MPKRELPMNSGQEFDALTGWRRLLNWRPGVRASIKRGYNKRVRRAAKQQIRSCEERSEAHGRMTAAANPNE